MAKKASMKARDWNEQFQTIVRRIHQFEEGESLRMKKTLNDSLFQLIQVTEAHSDFAIENVINTGPFKKLGF